MITINYRDLRPIYQQVKANFKELIAKGILAPGDKLPSVRELAVELAINPNTIQRAYKELEAEGVIYSVMGRGSFVSEDVDSLNVRREELMKQFDKLTSELETLGVTPEMLYEHMRKGREK